MRVTSTAGGSMDWPDSLTELDLTAELGELVATGGAAAVDWLSSLGQLDLMAELRSSRRNPERPNERLRLSAGTSRHYLNALSNLYHRTQSEGCVPPGYNPVAAMLDKPAADAAEAEWRDRSLWPRDRRRLLRPSQDQRSGRIPGGASKPKTAAARCPLATARGGTSGVRVRRGCPTGRPGRQRRGRTPEEWAADREPPRRVTRGRELPDDRR